MDKQIEFAVCVYVCVCVHMSQFGIGVFSSVGLSPRMIVKFPWTPQEVDTVYDKTVL